MATQHPDNAGKPYWHYRPFVSSTAEIKESFLCFSDLDIAEYNWDWEGKFVDEAVVDRLLQGHLSYFKKNPLGREKFLTFRFPNPRIESQFRLARALMVAITSSQLSRSLGFDCDPVFEAILPLTETAEELIDIQEAFSALVGIEHKLLKLNRFIRHLEIIPLFESVSTIINSHQILKKYIRLHRERFGKNPHYIRPYCARSDPALNSGLIPTIIALKIALNRYRQLERETGIHLYPMLGTGSLPFRGGLSPDTVDKCLSEYAGVSTLIIQSAFRYDFPKKRVIEAVGKINRNITARQVKKLTAGQINSLTHVLPAFEKPYRHTVESISPLINSLSLHVAKRRERLLHIGLFGYSRGMGKIKLPRAITFTAALYSIGVPPELIGSGRGLAIASKSKVSQDLSQAYIHLKQDLILAGQYLNKDNLKRLEKINPLFKDIREDVNNIERLFKIELGPVNKLHQRHARLTSVILDRFLNKKNVSRLITMTGQLRRSLG